MIVDDRWLPNDLNRPSGRSLFKAGRLMVNKKFIDQIDMKLYTTCQLLSRSGPSSWLKSTYATVQPWKFISEKRC